MVAIMKVYTDFGGTDDTPGTEEEATTVRFKQADGNTIDTNNPIVIPASGTDRSFWKHVYLFSSVAPASQIDNVRFWSDTTNGLGTGVDLYAGDETPTKNSGSDAGYDLAIGTTAMTDHTDITAQTSVFSLSSASPLTVSISEAGNIIDAISETSNYVILQMTVADTAGSGVITAETLTFQYDEI